MKTTIVIPARYASKRFPGKPLAMLNGKTILERVWEIASFVCQSVPNCSALVATEEPSVETPENTIIPFCKEKNIPLSSLLKNAVQGRTVFGASFPI